MLVILQLSDYDEQQTIKVTLSLFSQKELIRQRWIALFSCCVLT